MLSFFDVAAKCMLLVLEQHESPPDVEEALPCPLQRPLLLIPLYPLR